MLRSPKKRSQMIAHSRFISSLPTVAKGAQSLGALFRCAWMLAVDELFRCFPPTLTILRRRKASESFFHQHPSSQAPMALGIGRCTVPHHRHQLRRSSEPLFSCALDAATDVAL